MGLTLHLVSGVSLDFAFLYAASCRVVAAGVILLSDELRKPPPTLSCE